MKKQIFMSKFQFIFIIIIMTFLLCGCSTESRLDNKSSLIYNFIIDDIEYFEIPASIRLVRAVTLTEGSAYYVQISANIDYGVPDSSCYALDSDGFHEVTDDWCLVDDGSINISLINKSLIERFED